MRRIERENTGTVRPGQDLVVAGYAGLSGTMETVKNKREELYQWYSRDYVDRILESGDIALEGDLEKWKEFGASECEPAGEICERYDLNPYRLFSTGCLLFSADNGGDLVHALKEQGIHAAVIGKVTGGIKRIIDHGESVGYLDRPSEDELYKVLCPKGADNN